MSAVAPLHKLCARCKTALSRFPLDDLANHGYAAWEPKSVTLSQDFRKLVNDQGTGKYRCHFCTLIVNILTRNPDQPSWSHPQEAYEASSPRPVVLELISEETYAYFKVHCDGITVEPESTGYYAVMSMGDFRVFKLDINVCRESSSPFRSVIAETNTSSQSHLELARSWVEACTHLHQDCWKRRHAYTPTRLVRLGENDDDPPYLYISDLYPERHPNYCTLSYLWGGASFLKLMRRNIDDFVWGIPPETIPRTFRDAFKIARALRFEYIWIDALCIIQDSDDDKTKEIASMGLIYENSGCTIGAAAGQNPHNGCFFERDPLEYEPCRIFGDAEKGVYASSDSMRSSRGTTRWQSRGWVLQERLLSPRLLTFDRTEISWNCRESLASENSCCGPQRIDQSVEKTAAELNSGELPSRRLQGDPFQAFRRAEFEALLQALGSSPHQEEGAWGCKATECWQNIVCGYSKCSLTNGIDKLPAISGIVSRIIDNGGGPYHAGLWKNNLTRGLLWCLDPNFCQPRPSPPRAPTWSWASVDGEITYCEFENWTAMSKILGCSTAHHPLDKHGVGCVSGGILHIEGYLMDIEDKLSLREGPFCNEEGYLDCIRPVMTAFDVDFFSGSTHVGAFYPDFKMDCLSLRNLKLLLVAIELPWNSGYNSEEVHDHIFNGSMHAHDTDHFEQVTWWGLVLQEEGDGVFERIGVFYFPKMAILQLTLDMLEVFDATEVREIILV